MPILMIALLIIIITPMVLNVTCVIVEGAFDIFTK